MIVFLINNRKNINKYLTLSKEVFMNMNYDLNEEKSDE